MLCWSLELCDILLLVFLVPSVDFSFDPSYILIDARVDAIFSFGGTPLTPTR